MDKSLISYISRQLCLVHTYKMTWTLSKVIHHWAFRKTVVSTCCLMT